MNPKFHLFFLFVSGVNHGELGDRLHPRFSERECSFKLTLRASTCRVVQFIVCVSVGVRGGCVDDSGNGG